MKTTAETRPSAERVIHRDSSMIESSKRAGASMFRERAVIIESGAISERTAIVECGVIGERVMVDRGAAVYEPVAIDERSAVRRVSIVIENHRPAAPIKPPVVPAPAKSSEEANVDSESESEARSREVESRIGIPAGPDR